MTCEAKTYLEPLVSEDGLFVPEYGICEFRMECVDEFWSSRTGLDEGDADRIVRVTCP